MPDATTNPDRTYSVWLAFGEPIVVADIEPVWEEPGKQATLVGTIDAPDYETACRLWEAQARDKSALEKRAPGAVQTPVSQGFAESQIEPMKPA